MGLELATIARNTDAADTTSGLHSDGIVRSLSNGNVVLPDRQHTTCPDPAVPFPGSQMLGVEGIPEPIPVDSGPPRRTSR